VPSFLIPGPAVGWCAALGRELAPRALFRRCVPSFLIPSTLSWCAAQPWVREGGYASDIPLDTALLSNTHKSCQRSWPRVPHSRRCAPHPWSCWSCCGLVVQPTRGCGEGGNASDIPLDTAVLCNTHKSCPELVLLVLLCLGVQPTRGCGRAATPLTSPRHCGALQYERIHQVLEAQADRTRGQFSNPPSSPALPPSPLPLPSPPVPSPPLSSPPFSSLSSPPSPSPLPLPSRSLLPPTTGSAQHSVPPPTHTLTPGLAPPSLPCAGPCHDPGLPGGPAAAGPV